MRDRAAALYRQAHTGRLWYAVTGLGGTFGPIGDDLGYRGSCFEGWCVYCGPLPPAATVDAVTGEGERLSVHMASGAFLIVAPSSQDLRVTFRNARGRRV